MAAPLHTNDEVLQHGRKYNKQDSGATQLYRYTQHRQHITYRHTLDDKKNSTEHVPKGYTPQPPQQ
jgi:hypothetical protein